MKPNQTLVSYAHYDDDITLLRYLYKIENGFYVDIGANEPAFKSVTKMFYDAGWSGVNIEPLPEPYAQLVKERPRDVNIRAAAGSADKTQTLYKQGTLSTFNADMVRDKKNTPRLDVEIRNTTALVREAMDLSRQPIHFFKIDVEGYEQEALKGIDFSIVRPWMFAIEANHAELKNVYDSNKKSQRVPVWEEILLSNGYTFAEAVKINRYYVDGARPELIKERLSRPDVLRKYNIINSRTNKRILT
ncbi:MAG: FkbM family methyltransferase [Oscillospiraceae bacterium]|jgi:FkbM family methyltransferase|nr:FkbM family methyltransferase [Oscillospiraceae bacterium]